MEAFHPEKALRTQRAWDLMRKYLKAQYLLIIDKESSAGCDTPVSDWLEMVIIRLREALESEYHATALIFSVENPSINIDQAIRIAFKCHETQMHVSLCVSKEYKKEESLEVE